MYTEATFGWRNLESSKFISLVSIVRVFVPLGSFFPPHQLLVPRSARGPKDAASPARFSWRRNEGADLVDIWILRTALISDVIGVTGYIFVRTQELFVVCAIITAFGGLRICHYPSRYHKARPPSVLVSCLVLPACFTPWRGSSLPSYSMASMPSP